MIKLKRGVKLASLRPQMVLATSIIDGVYRELGYHTVITSGNDGKHSHGSLHYVGLAVDYRTRQLREGDAEKVKAQVAKALGAEYDVVLEPTHLHVEYQPKRS